MTSGDVETLISRVRARLPANADGRITNDARACDKGTSAHVAKVGFGSFSTKVEPAASRAMSALPPNAEVSYPVATQQEHTMTETFNSDGSSVAKPVPRPRSTKPATVSASALAQHLDCSRTYIGKLEAEGVIQRQGDGFPLDQSRVAYLRYLRRERQQSPRIEADAAHVDTTAIFASVVPVTPSTAICSGLPVSRSPAILSFMDTK
jgi:hypothetical protein